MAAINDLIKQIKDPELQIRIQKEVDKLSKQKKFGLVFEEHLPECTPLYDMPIKKGCNVMLRSNNEDKSVYVVYKLEDNKAYCIKKDSPEETNEFSINEIVRVAEFGEAIYPYLKPIDSICNAPDSDLWHTLIEADNYHALQLLEYLYAGKVDCIYIDPPYNTGARDWKYNNDYVDSGDQYRHSKWLSMIQKRLKIAKKLLNPANSVLIVTIDEKEYLHLGCLLEEMFPDCDGDQANNYLGRCKIQMISSVISFKGSARKKQFTRLDEYIFIIEFGEAAVKRLPLSDEWRINPDDERATHLTWKYLIRSGNAGLRERSPGNFYPVFFNREGGYHSIGEALPATMNRNEIIPPEGTFAVFPVDTQGREHYWNIGPDKFIQYKEKGYIKFGKPTKNGVPITFLTSGEITKVEQGIYEIDGYDENGAIISSNEVRDIMPGTQWRIKTHDATRHGTDLLTRFLADRQFPYPKSLYAVHDVINFFVADNKEALIVDFFAGSGTTLHAVNLLNAEDLGKRRAVIVTNNEVSGEEADALVKSGYMPGDDEWEAKGIAHYVTWPRTVCSIEGHDVNGKVLEGDYISSNTIEKETSRNVKQINYLKGFSEYKLSEKKDIVYLLSDHKIAKKEILDDIGYIISEEDVSILLDESCWEEWLEELEDANNVKNYIVITENNKLFKIIKNEINERFGTYKEKVPLNIPMSNGFKANAAFFKLGFLDKTAVALGMLFKEMLPTLWMKAGAHGTCPALEGNLPDMLILPENQFAVLLNENAFSAFAEKVNGIPEIETVFLITDYDINYRNMVSSLNKKTTYQLYRDYLDNFRINHGRN